MGDEDYLYGEICTNMQKELLFANKSSFKTY